MTARELADRFLRSKYTLVIKLAKIKAHCQAMNVRYEDVIALLPEDQRP